MKIHHQVTGEHFLADPFACLIIILLLPFRDVSILVFKKGKMENEGTLDEIFFFIFKREAKSEI